MCGPGTLSPRCTTTWLERLNAPTSISPGTDGDHHEQRISTSTADNTPAQAPSGEGEEAAKRYHEEGRESHQEGSLGEASRQCEEADSPDSPRSWRGNAADRVWRCFGFFPFIFLFCSSSDRICFPCHQNSVYPDSPSGALESGTGHNNNSSRTIEHLQPTILHNFEPYCTTTSWTIPVETRASLQLERSQ